MLGNFRRLDDLGRIVIPKDFREYHGMKERDLLEIICEEDCIVIKPKRKENPGKKKCAVTLTMP